MKKNYTIAAILLGVLAIVLLFYFFIMSPGEEEKGRQYHWKTNFKAGSDHPYGTQFIKELLRSYRPGEAFVYSDKKPLHLLLDSAVQTGAPTDYIFIGEIIFLDDADRDALLNFMNAGNDVFMAVANLPFDIVDTVYQNECDREIFLRSNDTTQVTMNLYHPALHTEKGYTYVFRDGNATYPFRWDAFNDEIFCDSVKSIIPLGYQDPGHVNFLRIPFGSGNLYLHSNPLVFTNYFVSKPDKAIYAADALSHLRGKGIIWDEFSKASFAGGGDDESYSSPLSYILQHESLKYGWWMMLAAIVLYTFFTAKRKQRVIPVLEEKVNTTLEFVKIVAALHFQNGNHLDIAKKKMKYFLYFIRAKYGMHTQHFTDEHIKRLSERSKVEINDLRIIFNEYQMIERNPYNTPGADRLITLYNAIDHFYKHCK